jgi:hypothetical protein
MAKRKGADFDPDYDPEAANHAGEMMQGSINTLWDKEPVGKPAVKDVPSIGFRLRKARSSADRVRRRIARKTK